MMPEPEPEPSGPDTSIMTTDGSTLWATFSIDPVAAVWAVDPPVWVSTGEDCTSSWVEVQIGRAADAGRTTEEQAGRHHGGGQPLATQTRSGDVDPVR